MFEGFFRRQEEGVGSDAAVAPRKHSVPVQRHVEGGQVADEEEKEVVDTQESREGWRSREILRTLNPKSIVVFGATGEDNMTKPGYWMGSNTSASFRGDIHLVNPSKDELRYGTKSYPCVKDFGQIAGDIDPETTTFIFAIPPKAILSVLEQYGEVIKHCVITTAGFKESKGGEENDAALQELVSKHGITVVGPNCVGIYASNVRTETDEQLGTLNATFAHHEELPESGLSMISSSGALVVGLMERLEHERIGVNKIVSIGNGTTEIGHLIDAFVMDPNTNNIAIYAEGITERDIDAVREATRQKPVYVILPKGGEAADRASSSHTAKALGSDVDVVRAALEQAGAVVLEDLEQFYDTIAFAERVHELPRTNVTAVTNSGGPGVLLAGYSSEGKYFSMPTVDERLQANLKEMFPTTGVSNPVDVRGDAGWVEYEKALTEVVNDEGTDIVLVTVLPTPLTPVEQIARGMVELQGRTEKRVVALFMGEEHMDEGRDILRRGGIAVFTSPERFVRAANNVHRATEMKYRPMLETNSPQEERVRQTNAVIEGVLADKNAEGLSRKALTAAETGVLLEAYGIRLVDSMRIEGDDDARAEALGLDFDEHNYVAKIDPKVYPGEEHKLHKVGGAGDAKAVYLGLKNEKKYNAAIEALRRDFPGVPIIVQPETSAAGEKLLIGGKRHAEFGINIAMGEGGAFAEQKIEASGMILRFNAFAGMDRALIHERLLSGKFKYLFTGKRGNPELAETLTDQLWGLYQMMQDHPEIKEVDFNPALLDGKDSNLVDVKVILSDKAPKAA